jgi:signal transduction histidine kinase
MGVRLTVADTGEGIRPDMRAHLFEPFQTTKEMTGTGLGLWVSKGIVEKHGGYIRMRTRRDKGHGTVFTVWLPVVASPNLTAPAN